MTTATTSLHGSSTIDAGSLAEDAHAGAHHGHGNGRLFGLGLAALGVVFGDIGTSPLYSLQTVFSEHHGAVAPTAANIYGVISMVFWCLTLIVTVKYLIFVLRADNDGEGGMLALVALLRDKLKGRLVALATLIGVVGAGLFYGDSVITPAISVLSAMEGLHVVNPSFERLVVPLGVIILTALFMIQRFGTSKVGKAFGPVMVLWFLVLAALGLPRIIANPRILAAISPHHALMFTIAHPFVAFIAAGAVVLTITGAEALYADMGHFGPNPIRLAWFAVVFPCLLVNYFGQGAMLLDHPEYIDNPFFRLAPSWATVPLVILATLATVIASQAVISGAYSVSRQAARLNLLPRLTIRHTSKVEAGQIYVPGINWILFIGVLLLISIFQSSVRLAAAYGLAATGTLLLGTILLMLTARHVWHWPIWAIVLFSAVIGTMEATLLAANLLKVLSGGWIPILVATLVMTIMTTWRKGTLLVMARREKIEGSLLGFVRKVNSHQVQRVPGFAVFPHRGRETTPLALKANLEFYNVLHEENIILNIVNENVPHIRHVEREHLDELEFDDGIWYVDCHVGFNDSQDIPKATRLAIDTFPQLAHLREEDAMYFVSIADVKREKNNKMAAWRKRLYRALAKAQADETAVYHTPKDRTVMLGAELYL